MKKLETEAHEFHCYVFNALSEAMTPASEIATVDITSNEKVSFQLQMTKAILTHL